MRADVESMSDHPYASIDVSNTSDQHVYRCVEH